MTEQNKTPAQEIIWRAQADQDLAALSEEQLKLVRRKFEVEQEALAHFDKKNSAKSQEDFARRVNSMGDAEFAKLKTDLMWQAARKGNS